MKDNIGRILVSEQALREKIEELGKRITEDYQGKDLLLVSILKGSCVFMSDLIRHIDLPLSIDFMYVSSYGSGTQTTGSAKIIKDMDVDISGKDVLLVEDILDSGVTLSHVIDLMKQRHPASLKLCALLNKPDRRKIPVQLDYEGFEIPDEFVVGYGLDYDERYRNLPFVGILKREVYMKSDGTKEDK